MPDIAIRVECLSKSYRIGQRENYATLRDTLTRSFCAPFQRLASIASRRQPTGSTTSGAGYDESTIWALKNITLDVHHGEALGIIGPNGAGKTTLLKLLSRITEPTTGQVLIRGRVASLLEVGTGFHPELTGRENIYLNGAILGMSRSEIERKFDEIVSFAEIERFLDTPVKRYSSGMYMRLAFAVAAHLEPEVLVVDEVLAVGDAEFQRKCLGKMSDVAGEGRTVLFVSHNMSAILRLCTRAVLLRRGEIATIGSPQQVVDAYLRAMDIGSGGIRTWLPEEATHPAFRPISAKIRQHAEAVETVSSRYPFVIEFEYELLEPLAHLLIQLEILSRDGVSLLVTQDRDTPDIEAAAATKRAAGRYVARCRVPPFLLNEGSFDVSIYVTSRPKVGRFFHGERALRFAVDTTGGVGSHLDTRPSCLLRPVFPWSVTPVESIVNRNQIDTHDRSITA